MDTVNCEDIISCYDNPKLLKKGGQKVVYHILHPLYGPSVIKIGGYSSSADLERIKREVALLQSISSVYYPKSYDFNILEDKRFVIIEEFIESSPLSYCYKRFETPKNILFLVRHLTIGLKLLWDNNIVHRDVKPDNILITNNNVPKIIDLGIARLLNYPSLTKTYYPRGPCTPYYASPEQLWNRKQDIDDRTDQFCLGIILTQLLLRGKHPFSPDLVGGDSIDNNILNDNWDRSILENIEVSELKLLIKKLLGHEPFERYRRSEDLLTDINCCIKGYD